MNQFADVPPPEWTPATEPSRDFGLKPENEAPRHEFLAAEDFCEQHPVHAPRLLPSADIDQIIAEGCRAWTLVPPQLERFKGTIRDVISGNGANTSGDRRREPKVVEVMTEKRCGYSCILSNYPIIAGMYDIQGKEGVYYEVTILQMDGIVAIGTACLPYPSYRLPGWNRLSAGLHLDDMHKFFEDPNGGRLYDARSSSLGQVSLGDTIGCGFVFNTGTIFYTYNGVRLEDAFRGVYLPRTAHDVYAAIGVSGPGENRIRVNFGAADGEQSFRWKPGREWAWNVEGLVGQLAAGGAGEEDELPGYTGFGEFT